MLALDRTVGSRVPEEKEPNLELGLVRGISKTKLLVVIIIVFPDVVGICHLSSDMTASALLKKNQ